MYPDFLELLRVFAKHRVAYALIGGYAVGIHAEPRHTKESVHETALAALYDFSQRLQVQKIFVSPSRFFISHQSLDA